MQTIQDILSENNIAYTEADDSGGRAGWIQTTCPDCGDRSSKGHNKYYLGISLATGAANCWRCGRKNTAKVLAALTGKTAGRMRERVDGADLLSAPIRKAGRLRLPKGLTELSRGHMAYLARRGMDGASIADLWGVQGIGQAKRLGWRLFIPIHHHGEVVSWTTRSIRPSETMRYISAGHEEEAVPHKELLYGADYCRHAIIIHEGPLDVWATGPGAVATCGLAYTDAQLLAMSKYPVRVVCFDTEDAAQNRAKGLADALSVFPGSTHNVLLETGDDTADADPAEVAELRETFLQ